jgi:hypothetical protein
MTEEEVIEKVKNDLGKYPKIVSWILSDKNFDNIFRPSIGTTGFYGSSYTEYNDFSCYNKIIYYISHKNNPSFKLKKENNILLYNGRKDIEELICEINDMSNTNEITIFSNKLGTDKKAHIDEMFLKDSSKAVWFEKTFLPKFKMLPGHRKDKFFASLGSNMTYEEFVNFLDDAILATYEWNRDSFASFLDDDKELQYDIIFDKNKVVILKIKDYYTARMLSGGGKTKWCFTHSLLQWNNYSNTNNETYFVFNFNLNEINVESLMAFTQTNIFQTSTSNNRDNHHVQDFRGVIKNICNGKDQIADIIADKLSLRDITREWVTERVTDEIVFEEEGRMYVYTGKCKDSKFDDFNKLYGTNATLIYLNFNADIKERVVLFNVFKNGINYRVTYNTSFFPVVPERDCRFIEKQLDKTITSNEMLSFYIEGNDYKKEFILDFIKTNIKSLREISGDDLLRLLNSEWFDVILYLHQIGKINVNSDLGIGETLLTYLLLSYDENYEDRKYDMCNEIEKLIIAVLQDKSLDINATTYSKDNAFTTCASLPSCINFARMIFEFRGLNVNQIDKEGKNAWQNANEVGNYEFYAMRIY